MKPTVVRMVGRSAEAALARLRDVATAESRPWPATTVLLGGAHTSADIGRAVTQALDIRHGDALDRSRPELLIVGVATECGAELAAELAACQQVRASLQRAGIDCRVGLFLFTEPLPDGEDCASAAQAAVRIARTSPVPDFVLAMHTFDHRQRAVGCRADTEALLAETLRVWLDPLRDDLRSRLHLQFRMAPLQARWFALGIQRLQLVPPGLGEAVIATMRRTLAPAMLVDCGRGAAMHLSGRDLQQPDLGARLLRELDEQWRAGASLPALHRQCDDYVMQIDTFLARERSVAAAAAARAAMLALRPAPVVPPRAPLRGWRRLWQWLVGCWHAVCAMLGRLFRRPRPVVRPPAALPASAKVDQQGALVAVAACATAIESALSRLRDEVAAPMTSPDTPWVHWAGAAIAMTVDPAAQRECGRAMASVPLPDLLAEGALRARLDAWCREHAAGLVGRLPASAEAAARAAELLRTVAAPWPDGGSSRETFVITPPGVETGLEGVTSGIGHPGELLVLELARGLRVEGPDATVPQESVA